ncbi:CRISPR-associated helicase Cas3' [Leyella stercorea]|uniref:CRISPR-associated helicase Cas3' n=1 Tax=Leyella stercorea TaxID=363265 RepID=UPI00242EAC20|nr:CRISPR-associated helicase Cas3' [Leyella stercorea]
MKQIISHLYTDNSGNWVIQSNDEHSMGVAKLASQFAGEFGMSEYGKVLGLLHDKGKETDAFQRYIKSESGYDPNIKIIGKHHHAYVGGILAQKYYGKAFSNLFVNQIVSHHTGLHDTDEIKAIVNQDIPSEVNIYHRKEKLNRPGLNMQANDFHHLARMLFSCLVDADYLDTEAFMDKESSALRKNKDTLKDLLPLLENKLKDLKSKADCSEVNIIRNQILQQCIKMADTPIGFYSLTVPTGGGKTLSSLVWAMKHAIKNGQKRIVIAIPYTSIIVQTASILRSIFGEENVLEHHSCVDPEQIKDERLKEKMKLATENWDYPIIVTTNVQLFESMFCNKPSACRKLHNIVNSVIIQDEVQTLPMDYLQPIVDSLKTYNKLFNVSFLFTTASQPVLSGLIEGCNPKAAFNGIDHITEIIPDDFKLHEKLRRVKLSINDEGKNYDEVAEMLSQHKRVLCIVNTRRDAKEIYQRLSQEGVTLHLSKMMCPDHISETIKSIKTALKDDKNEIIRVVSTQLIEAGVDLDFPVVFRQEAGLDSILQAAGRCNREGRCGLSTTYVFSLSKEHSLPKGDIQAANSARLNLGNDHDWFAPETMTSFFKQLYCRKESFDKKDIRHYLYYPTNNLSFQTAAKEFQLIEDDGVNVVVCWKNSIDLVQQLLVNGPSYMLMKKLSKFMVNINRTDFKALVDMGVVSEKKEGLFVVDYKQQYDEHIGLRTDNNWTNEILIQ